MKGSNLVALLLGFTASTLSEFVALDFNVLRGDLDKRSRNKDQPQLVQRGFKRDGLALMTLSNKKSFHIATLKIGSNKDEVKVDIDTGSSDLWVMGNNVNCTRSNCTAYGTFNPKNSKSYKDNHTGFYSSEYYSMGTWSTDTVTFGNISLPDFIFAVVNNTESTSGVLGLGLANYKTSFTSFYGLTQYENFPLRLKSEGIINKAVFSVYLSDQDTGSVLFGAVDNAKYSGTLTTVPIVNSTYEGVYQYTIMVHNMSLSNNGKTANVSDTPQLALLDTGATLSQFPGDVLAELTGLMGGVKSTYLDDGYLIPCYSSSNTTTFDINFSGATVQIPISDLVMPLKSSNLCHLGVSEVSMGDPIILGDNILRSLYVVYDLDAHQLSVAQAKYTNDTDIQVISSTIPHALSAELYSSSSFSLWETYRTHSSGHSSGVKVDSGFMFFISILAGMLLP